MKSLRSRLSPEHRQRDSPPARRTGLDADRLKLAEIERRLVQDPTIARAFRRRRLPWKLALVPAREWQYAIGAASP
jgi:hypothetical protein